MTQTMTDAVIEEPISSTGPRNGAPRHDDNRLYGLAAGESDTGDSHRHELPRAAVLTNAVLVSCTAKGCALNKAHLWCQLQLATFDGLAFTSSPRNADLSKSSMVHAAEVRLFECNLRSVQWTDTDFNALSFGRRVYTAPR